MIKISDISNYFSYLCIFLLLSSLIYFGHAEVTGAYTTFNNPLKPSLFYLLVYCTTFIVLVFGQDLLARTRPYHAIMAALAGILLLHLWWVPFLPGDAERTRILVLRVNTCLIAMALAIVLAYADDIAGLIRSIRIVMWGTAALNVAVIIMPGLFPFKMGVYAGRAAGLYWDPNQCATFLALSLPLACLGTRTPVRLANYLVFLVGIAFTFSREGLVLWLGAVILDYVFLARKVTRVEGVILRSTAIFLILIAIGAVFAIFYYDIIYAMRPYLNADTFSRLMGADRGSAGERLRLIVYGWEAFASSPLAGLGYGSTHLWSHGLSVHNMFLLMLAEFGLLGLVAYLGLLGAILAQGSRLSLVLFILLTCQSMFTHSYFDLPYYLLLVLLYMRVGHAERQAETARPAAIPSPLREAVQW